MMIPFAYHLASGDDYAVDLDEDPDRLADERPFDPATTRFFSRRGRRLDGRSRAARSPKRSPRPTAGSTRRRTPPAPAPRGFLLNRSRTDGRYGISPISSSRGPSARRVVALRWLLIPLYFHLYQPYNNDYRNGNPAALSRRCPAGAEWKGGTICFI